MFATGSLNCGYGIETDLFDENKSLWNIILHIDEKVFSCTPRRNVSIFKDMSTSKLIAFLDQIEALTYK